VFRRIKGCKEMEPLVDAVRADSLRRKEAPLHSSRTPRLQPE
jgi:hypothetical protein